MDRRPEHRALPRWLLAALLLAAPTAVCPADESTAAVDPPRGALAAVLEWLGLGDEDRPKPPAAEPQEPADEEPPLPAMGFEIEPNG